MARAATMHLMVMARSVAWRGEPVGERINSEKRRTSALPILSISVLSPSSLFHICILRQHELRTFAFPGGSDSLQSEPEDRNAPIPEALIDERGKRDGIEPPQRSDDCRAASRDQAPLPRGRRSRQIRGTT